MGIIVLLSGLIATELINNDYKTVELFKNSTRIIVPSETNLVSHDDFSTTYNSTHSTIIGINTHDPAGALAAQISSNIIIDSANFENGIYHINKDGIRVLGDKTGLGVNEDKLKDCYVKILINTTVNQTIFIIGDNINEVNKIAGSVQWKKLNNLTEETTPINVSETTTAIKEDNLVKYDNADGIGLSDVEYSKQQEAYDAGYAQALEDYNEDDIYYEDDIDYSSSSDAYSSSSDAYSSSDDGYSDNGAGVE